MLSWVGGRRAAFSDIRQDRDMKTRKQFRIFRKAVRNGRGAEQAEGHQRDRVNQRYDLLAISLLMFTAVFAVWLVALPINLEVIRKWQTLLGILITGLGVLVAAWNVTRQMRSAARVREQDRIERELPGLRAASFLLARFAVAIGKEPKPEKILKEFDAIGLKDAKMSDFLANVVEGLPLTPDFTKRELALKLYQLRHRTAQCANHEVQLAQARNLYAARKQAGDDLTEARTEVADADTELEAAQKKFHEALQTLEKYRKNLTRRIRSEAKRNNILRREHERSLSLD
jgi:hypothetical protein